MQLCGERRYREAGRPSCSLGMLPNPIADVAFQVEGVYEIGAMPWQRIHEQHNGHALSSPAKDETVAAELLCQRITRITLIRFIRVHSLAAVSI
jgi:hypothetical protein